MSTGGWREEGRRVAVEEGTNSACGEAAGPRLLSAAPAILDGWNEFVRYYFCFYVSEIYTILCSYIGYAPMGVCDSDRTGYLYAGRRYFKKIDSSV